MKKYDIVIIGGGPSGIVTAMTAKKQHSEKNILMITEAAKGLVPCGIPYVFHELDSIEQNVMGPKPFVEMGGELLIDRVDQVDVPNRVVSMQSGEEIGYDRLVFATGSRPAVPTFIKGHDFANGIGYVPKSYEGILLLQKQTATAKKIIVLGSGFTAVEMAEQLAQEPDKQIHLVYRAEHCLHRSLSPELATKVDDALVEAGVILHHCSQIAEITGSNDTATGIRLDDGQTLDADLIIAAMGYQPNSEIAAAAGLSINEHDAIVVDNYLRTSAKDVFAVGDCAQTIGFITGRPGQVMLASTAAAEARILGYNLYSMNIRRNFPGALSVFSTELAGHVFSSAGVIEPQARAADIDVVIGQFNDIDRHPGALPNVSPIGVRLIVSPADGQIIGGELFGGKSMGEMINTISLAIQKNVTVYELLSFQLGTHPLLTTAPTKPILIKAAEHAIAQIQKKKEVFK